MLKAYYVIAEKFLSNNGIYVAALSKNQAVIQAAQEFNLELTDTDEFFIRRARFGDLWANSEEADLHPVVDWHVVHQWNATNTGKEHS